MVLFHLVKLCSWRKAGGQIPFHITVLHLHRLGLVVLRPEGVAHVGQVSHLLPCSQCVCLAVYEEEPLLVLAELQPLHEALDGGDMVVLNTAGAHYHHLANVNKIGFD